MSPPSRARGEEEGLEEEEPKEDDVTIEVKEEKSPGEKEIAQAKKDHAARMKALREQRNRVEMGSGETTEADEPKAASAATADATSMSSSAVMQNLLHGNLLGGLMTDRSRLQKRLEELKQLSEDEKNENDYEEMSNIEVELESILEKITKLKERGRAKAAPTGGGRKAGPEHARCEVSCCYSQGRSTRQGLERREREKKGGGAAPHRNERASEAQCADAEGLGRAFCHEAWSKGGHRKGGCNGDGCGRQPGQGDRPKCGHRFGGSATDGKREKVLSPGRRGGAKAQEGERRKATRPGEEKKDQREKGYAKEAACTEAQRQRERRKEKSTSSTRGG